MSTNVSEPSEVDLGSRVTVQFAPCGHVDMMSLEKLFELGGRAQHELCVAGVKLDAPILDCKHCPDCADEARRQARLASEYDVDLANNYWFGCDDGDLEDFGLFPEDF